jgi:predicted nucleic acid-binding protein
MEIEERKLSVLRKKGEKIERYNSSERNDFVNDEDIIGFDANVLVDIVWSDEFKQEIRDRVFLNVLKIYTTEIALGEARQTLIKKKGYTHDKATNELKEILREFSINKIKHKKQFNNLGNKWVGIVKKKMYIKKFDTFPNDCKILSNLIGQKNINVYFTEDKDIAKATKLLKLKVRIKIIPEAENLTNSKIREWTNQMNKSRNKFRKHR